MSQQLAPPLGAAGQVFWQSESAEQVGTHWLLPEVLLDVLVDVEVLVDVLVEVLELLDVVAETPP